MGKDTPIPAQERRATDQSHSDLMQSVAEIQVVQKAIQREQASAKEEQHAVRDELKLIRAELLANSELTAKNTKSTAEMLELFDAAKGAFKVLGWIGTGIKWSAGFAAACVAIWALLHGNWPNLPGPPK